MKKSTEQKINVNFVIEGFSCQGILYQEDNRFYLDVTSPIPNISYQPKKIICYQGNQIIVLHENLIRSKRIFPTFVVDNYERSFFYTFSFCLDGLQDFLSESEDRNGFVFSEQIKIDNDLYTCDCFNDTEKTLITIKSPCHSVEINRINFIVQRFVQLFTLLSYKRITCSSIHIVEEKEEYEFFSWMRKSFVGQRGRHYSLLHAGLVYKNCCWRNILVNFFERKHLFFKSCLNGYIDLIDGDSLFGHNIINVYGIWDCYTKLVREKVDCQYTSQDFDEVFDYLHKMAKKDYMKFSGSQQKVIDDLFEKREPIKHTIGPHFYERFCALYNQIDENFRRLFPSALCDFKFLKKARSKYAHGEINYRPKEGFEELYQIFRRIRLMTIVFIYEELGISLIDICKGLRNSLHGHVINVELDRFVLSSIINDTPFFIVDEKTWKYFDQPRIYSCFNYNPLTNLLEIDKEVSEKAWKDSMNVSEPFYGNHVTKVCPKCKEPVYLNNVFLIYKNSHREVWGSFLLNYEMVPNELKEKCEIQRTDLLLKRYKSR